MESGTSTLSAKVYPGNKDMSPVTQDANLQRIKRRSRILKWVAVVLAILVPLTCLRLLFGDQEEIAFLIRLGSIEFNLTPFKRIIGGAMVLIVTLVASYGLFQLRKLFSLFQMGEFFTTQTIDLLTRFGRAIFFFGVLKTVMLMAMPPLMTHDSADGAIWVVGVSLSDLLIMITGGAVWLASWVMLEGKRLSDEMEGVI